MVDFEQFVSPQILHAVTVHIPVALAVLGIPLVYAGAAISTGSNTLRWTALTAYVLLAGAAAAAVYTGEEAARAIPGSAPGEIWDTVGLHESMATKVWMFALATAVCLVLSLARTPWARKTGITLAMAASLVTAGWVGFTGHLGGTLVYHHGVGSPYHPVLKPSAAEELDGQAITNAPSSPTPADGSAADGADQPEQKDADAEVIPVRAIEETLMASVSYEQHIQPMMEKHCIECHGFMEQRGELDLRSVEAMLEGGEKAGPAIVPGKPDESPLVQYSRGALRPRMPKDEPPLTADQIHLMRAWIAAGAPKQQPSDSSGPNETAELLEKHYKRPADFVTNDPEEALKWLRDFE